MTQNAHKHWLTLLMVVLFGSKAYAQANSSVARALEPLGRVSDVAHEQGPSWLWTELQLFDEPYPLTVDVVASTESAPKKVVYFLPGGGTNFHATFFIPHDANLPHYFREHGYLVVGITPREESVPESVNDRAFAAGWGLAKHRADVRRVIEKVQAALGLPYEVLGHSYGASLALDYGASFSHELERLVILDIYAFNPQTDAQSVRNAQSTYSAYNQLLGLGMYLESMGGSLSSLASWTDADRKQDSGVPRALFGAHRGNFTNESLYYFGFIEAAQLPGTHTLITGLEYDWPMVKGLVAGTYNFADSPQGDTYALTHVSDALLVAASKAATSGLVPAAFSRDYWAAVAGNDAYKLDWSAIQCPLLWVNTELGYAQQYYGATAARAAGNHNVTTHVVAGYGHSDIFLGKNARTEVWPLLSP